MAEGPKRAEQITDLGEARARITELDQKLGEAIDLLVKRNDEVLAARQRIQELEAQLSAATSN